MARTCCSRTGRTATTSRPGVTPYWTRAADGTIAVQPLVEYDTLDKHPNGVLKGGWYIGPKETQRESVLAPLPYIVQGKQVWLATLSVPIVVDGRFLGVAGTDYNLDFVQKVSEEVSGKLFDGQGEVAIISDQGLIVAESRKPELIGQHFQKILPDWQALLGSIQGGEELARLDDDGMVTVFAPIELGRTGKPWSMMLRIDKDIVLAQAAELEREMSAQSERSVLQQIGVGVLISLLAVVAVLLAFGGTSHSQGGQPGTSHSTGRSVPAAGSSLGGRGWPVVAQPRSHGRQPAGAGSRSRSRADFPGRPGGRRAPGIRA